MGGFDTLPFSFIETPFHALGRAFFRSRATSPILANRYPDCANFRY